MFYLQTKSTYDHFMKGHPVSHWCNRDHQ